MGPGRIIFLLGIVLMLISMGSPAEGGWWFSEESLWEKSGLDLEQGYDRNTVVTRSGKVISVDAQGSSGPVLAVMQEPAESTILVLGPKEFWNKSGFNLTAGNEVTVKGSKAMGKDGKSYLIVQSITVPATGAEISLRNETGRPAWSGNNRPERQRQMQMRQFRGGRMGR